MHKMAIPTDRFEKVIRPNYSPLQLFCMVCAVVLLGSLFSGCFESSTPQNGTETHFLKYCDTTCEGQLRCVSGLCTTHCTDSESCGVLSEHAVCTEAGLGGEAEPICDIACDTEADCHKVSARLGCRDGFCREPELDSKEPSGEDAGRLEYNPPDSGGRSTDEDAGTITDSVYLCPDDLEVTDDPMNVLYREINGGELTLVVQCCGSCQQQDFSLCYDDFGPWNSSDPVRVTTRLINNQNSYMCDEGLETNLHFDLTPIAQTYRESISAEGGLVETSHGLYLFKQLSCPDRQAYADILSSQVLFRADKQCTGPSDCQIVNPSIVCYDECLGGAVSLQGSETVDAYLEMIDTVICGDFEADGCDAVAMNLCPYLLTISTCFAGECVEAASMLDNLELLSCVDALNSGIQGPRCSRDCTAYDGCCSRVAWCTDQREFSPEEEWSCGSAITTTCSAKEPNADLSGTTPLGPLDLTYAWAGFTRGFAQYLELFFTQSPTAQTCEAERLGVKLFPGSDEDYSGVHYLPVTLYKDGARATAIGMVDISNQQTDGQSLQGSLRITDNGWNFIGSFTATECDDLGYIGP